MAGSSLSVSSPNPMLVGGGQEEPRKYDSRSSISWTKSGRSHCVLCPDVLRIVSWMRR